MMAKEPARRFQTPIEVARALEPFFTKRAIPSSHGTKTAVSRSAHEPPDEMINVPDVVAACENGPVAVPGHRPFRDAGSGWCPHACRSYRGVGRRDLSWRAQARNSPQPAGILRSGPAAETQTPALSPKQGRLDKVDPTPRPKPADTEPVGNKSKKPVPPVPTPTPTTPKTSPEDLAGAGLASSYSPQKEVPAFERSPLMSQRGSVHSHHWRGKSTARFTTVSST